jgi:hypothetical protein
MSMKFQIVVIAFCALIVLTPTRASAAERQFLFHTHETPTVQIEKNEIVGNVAGEVVNIDLSTVGAGLKARFVISAAIMGVSLGRHSIDLRRLPNLDLGSASYYAQPKTRTIKVELRYSEERDCFVNDDGRDRLVIVFEQGRSPQDYSITYEGCEPMVSLSTSGLQ